MRAPEGLAARGPLGVYSDAARRMSDGIMTALLADPEHVAGKWMAFRLSDGGTDGVAYPRPTLAAKHQLHPKQCFYLQVDRGAVQPRACATLLETARRMYANPGYDVLVALERLEAAA